MVCLGRRRFRINFALQSELWCSAREVSQGDVAAMISRTYVPMLFGALLCGLVISRFRGWLKSCLPSEPAEVRASSR